MEDNGHLNSKKIPRHFDELIEHMTGPHRASDEQYIQLGFSQTPAPASSNLWAEYTASTASHPYISVPNTAENQVFLQDLPVHYDMMSKQSDRPPHPNYYYIAAQQHHLNTLGENREMVGTVVDGGGNVVNVVYGGRAPTDTNSGLMQQSYLMSHDTSRDSLHHPLGSYMPYHQTGMIETNGVNTMRDYDLFNSSEIHHHQQRTRPIQQPSQMQYSNTAPTNNGTQIIENLVGNWVPNQSGTYSPFGCTDNSLQHVSISNQQGIQTSGVIAEPDKDGKGIGRGTRRTRIVAEVRPMRPTYSDVLAKSAPQPPASGIVIKPNPTNQNTGNKSESVAKSKSNSGSKNGSGKKNKSGMLKRQHSSGSDEQNGNGNMPQTKCIQSPGPTRKSTGLSNKNISFNSMPRKWVSLDDLDSDKQNSKIEEGVFQSEDSSPRAPEPDSVPVPEKKIGSNSTPKTKQDDKWYSVGTSTLNNHKVPAHGGGTKGPSTGGPAAKRPPIHINNNLGSTPWEGTAEKNVVLKGAKNCKSAVTVEEKKGSANNSSSTGAKTEGKPSVRTSSVRSSSVSGTQTAAPSQGKRAYRNKKKECHSSIALVCRPFKQHLSRWGEMGLQIMFWFLHLLSDVLGMSIRLFVHLVGFVYDSVCVWSLHRWRKVASVLVKWRIFNFLGFSSGPKKIGSWWKFWRWGKTSKSGIKTPPEEVDVTFKDGLESNMALPSTGDEAMKRLLGCKGKDPYRLCIHKERRKAYDRRVAETQQVEQAWSELSDLLSQLHQKMEYAANTISVGLSAETQEKGECGWNEISKKCAPIVARDIAVSMWTDLVMLLASVHSARSAMLQERETFGSESSMFGFLWHYFACMDGAVYDITEWAACQAENLRHLRANTHNVQYRIVLGKQQAQQSSSWHHRHRPSQNEPDLEDFLSNLYSQPGSGSSEGATEQARTRKKSKRKK
uniref:(California timema) hypothetical protein n=1 Tax=Timema californicum TaxID=61474 RepID=A0A7R9J3E7_TIMCA|nr:unnamed protein product [Timema californicum]